MNNLEAPLNNNDLSLFGEWIISVSNDKVFVCGKNGVGDIVIVGSESLDCLITGLTACVEAVKEWEQRNATQDKDY